MANIQHHYKSFPLFGSVSAAEDMTCKQTVWTFNDVSNNSPNYRLSISHIMRDGGVDDGESDYYGHNARLNLSERLLEENGTLYYVDPIGDKYEVGSVFVTGKGLRLATATPAWVSAKSLFASLNPGNLRWLIDVTNENIVKGFNSAGYLVFMSDEKRHLFYLNRTDIYNVVINISEISGETQQLCYLFTYNDSEQDGNNFLNKIRDYLNNRNVSYTYADNAHITKITQEKGATYDLTYDAGHNLTRIVSSEGYMLNCQKATNSSSISVHSTLSGIPQSGTQFNYTNSPMSQWKIAYSGDTCTITDIDGVKEYYKMDLQNRILIYAKEVHGVVIQAYKTTDFRYVSLTTEYVKNEYLYVPYSTLMINFEDKLGEKEIIGYFNGLPSIRTISNRRIAVNNTGTYSTVDITTNYYYDPNNPSQCTSENTTVTLNLYNGTTKTFTPVKTHEYNDQGLLQKTTSYIGDNYKQERAKEYQEFNYTFNEDGSYKKCTSKYRGSSYVRFRTEENYDELGRKISEKDPAGNFYINYAYIDDSDLIESIENPAYDKRTFSYDSTDNLESVSSSGMAGSNEIQRNYGEVICLNGNDKIDIKYDSKRRPWYITISGNDFAKFITYSENDDIQTFTAENEKREVIKCESAKDGSHEKLYYNDSLQLTNNYNIKGELTSVTDSISNENVTYGYNSLGQLTSYTEKQNNATKVKQTFVYDEYGNLSTDTITGEQDIITSYDYEDTSDRRFKGMSFGGATEEVTYNDDLNRLKTKKITFNGKEIYTKTYGYRDVKQGAYTNATNQPKSIKFTKGGQIKQQVVYNYSDATGQLSGMNVNGKSIEYTYKDNKLIQEKNYLLGTKSTKNYSFRGNISSDKKEILLSGGGSDVDEIINYIYNGDFMKYYGSRPCMYDAMGNPTMYCGKNAKWKGRQLTEFDGNYFNYDGRGRRMRKNAINYVYDSDGRLIRQYKDESKIIEPQTFIFYYDFEGVAAFKYTDKNNNGTMFFYLRDGQGNIIAIVDSTGSVVVQYYYDAWGNHKVVDANGDEITNQNNIGNLNPFRYRGYYYDTETGLYFLQTRYYDPEVGRFLNRDSVQYADPETINGLNLYAYCLNNPVEYADPTGHFVISAIVALAILGGVIGGTVGGVAMYNIAKNSGVEDAALILYTILGVLGGGAAGAALGAAAGYLLGGTAVSGAVAIAGGGTASVGATLAKAGACILGLGILFSIDYHGKPNSTVGSGNSIGIYDNNGNLIYRKDLYGKPHYVEGYGYMLPHTHVYQWKFIKGAWRIIKKFTLPF